MTFEDFAKMKGAGDKHDSSDSNMKATEEIENYFIKRYTTPAGVHIESVLSGLGASAGFGCQRAIWVKFVKPGLVPEKRAFVEIETKNGQKYYFGDFLNQPLLNTNQISVWTLTAAGAVKAGASSTSLPDAIQIVKHNAETVGTPEFGVPQLPKDHFPKEMPIVALRGTWNDVESILRNNHVDPQFWGWVPALAAQKTIVQNKDKIDPALAAKIVMESALPMSKVDPSTVLAKSQATNNP